MALLLCGPYATVQAATCTAIANGNWASGSTWSCGRAPAAGDVLVIPQGRTVTVTTNINYSGSLMRIRVYGALFFNGGGAKISLPCNSIVEVMTPSAQISGNSGGNSQTIKICNTTYWSASAGPVSGYSAWPVGSTLPVELIGFEGESTNGPVQLTWATATELNCDRYRILRSSDNDVWTIAGELNGAGTSQQIVTYRFQDIPERSGLYYYQLLQFDSDGSENDLGTIAVQLRTEEAIICYPSPSSGPVHVMVSAPGGVLELFDRKGMLLDTYSALQRNTDIDLSGHADGMYVLRYTDQGRVMHQRVSIQH